MSGAGRPDWRGTRHYEEGVLQLKGIYCYSKE